METQGVLIVFIYENVLFCLSYNSIDRHRIPMGSLFWQKNDYASRSLAYFLIFFFHSFDVDRYISINFMEDQQ